MERRPSLSVDEQEQGGAGEDAEEEVKGVTMEKMER